MTWALTNTLVASSIMSSSMSKEPIRATTNNINRLTLIIASSRLYLPTTITDLIFWNRACAIANRFHITPTKATHSSNNICADTRELRCLTNQKNLLERRHTHTWEILRTIKRTGFGNRSCNPTGSTSQMSLRNKLNNTSVITITRKSKRMVQHRPHRIRR